VKKFACTGNLTRHHGNKKILVSNFGASQAFPLKESPGPMIQRYVAAVREMHSRNFFFWAKAEIRGRFMSVQMGWLVYEEAGSCCDRESHWRKSMTLTGCNPQKRKP
jgi:hypothetical protein